jgi:flagellar basal body-associated protein FliL
MSGNGALCSARNIENSDKEDGKMKRNKLLVLMLVIFAVSLIIGCSTISQTVTPRDSLKVDQALIGHWINSTGSPEYYFSATGLTKVEKGGSTTNLTYVVLQSNDSANTLNIRVTNPNDLIQGEDMREIRFSTDKKTMTETVSLLSIKISENSYTYVDSKTQP